MLNDCPIIFLRLAISFFGIYYQLLITVLYTIYDRILHFYALLIINDCFCNIIIIHIYCFFTVLTKDKNFAVCAHTFSIFSLSSEFPRIENETSMDIFIRRKHSNVTQSIFPIGLLFHYCVINPTLRILL